MALTAFRERKRTKKTMALGREDQSLAIKWDILKLCFLTLEGIRITGGREGEGPVKNTYSWAPPQIFAIRMCRAVKTSVWVILKLPWVFFRRVKQVLRLLESRNLGSRPNFITC